jgi:hypothetical protein
MRGSKYIPTPADRETVMSMAACGCAHERIAKCIGVNGIDDKTLRKHFRRELDTAMAKANATVANKAYQMAIAGNPSAATFFWLKCRANWKETQAFEHSGPGGGAISLRDRNTVTSMARKLRLDSRAKLNRLPCIKRK